MTRSLEERNVTRAGQRVGLTQPAMSAALARLRRHFDAPCCPAPDPATT
ncbi:LysR family transcriptional regulator [Saccharothrix xinjiangensis]|uniref:LysR family transcriptional regulator n=1 Tax=Saccharothrix xinjiangensis TaxID=204798 RepID=A0ABV9Y4M1_9PSEU